MDPLSSPNIITERHFTKECHFYLERDDSNDQVYTVLCYVI